MARPCERPFSGALRWAAAAAFGVGLGGTLLFTTPAHAARVPADVVADLKQLHNAHGSPLLLVTQSPDVLADLNRWVVRTDHPYLARRLPTVGTESYERQIALKRVGLRCGVLIGPTWRLEPFGDCSTWAQGPKSVDAAIPRRQPTTPRRERFERGATIAVGPIMGTGTVVDFSAEARVSKKGSAVFTYTAIQVREWGSPALMAVQARRYFLGDVDRGLYGLAQVGLLSTELGTVRSPGIAAGLGLKYTTNIGFTMDGYLGAGPGYPVRVQPAVGGRLGWAF